MLLYQVTDFGEGSFLDAYVANEQYLIDIDVVDMADELFALEFVGEQAEEEKEESMRVGSQAYDLEVFHVLTPSLDALDGPFDPAL